MIGRWTGLGFTLLVATTAAVAQTSNVDADRRAQPGRWRAPSETVADSNDRMAGHPIRRVAHEDSLGPRAGVTHGTNTLPNADGQVWREYDLRPYTSHIKDSDRPEQAVVDWILRETGTESWFSEPLGLLCASRERLRVYHTREMQAVVSNIVDRFVSKAAEAQVFGLRLMTVGSPHWRTKAQEILHPVEVRTPGIDAWLLSKEDAARFVAELRKRPDSVEHNSPNLLVQRGQTQTIRRTRPLPHVRSVQRRPEAWPTHQLQMGQIEEGITIQLSPLLSRDGQDVDAVLKFSVTQIEKLTPVWIDVPTSIDPRQRTQIQVPQTSSWQLHERFRWPADQVLMISCGMVPAPTMARPKSPGLPRTIFGSPRVDALLLVEAKGPAANSGTGPTPELRTGNLKYRGRY